MRTLKLTIAYDGTDFAGWQRQADARTVQATLEEALARIEGRPVAVTAAGRTDAGVHAERQVASVSLAAALALDELFRALNATLPADVRVLAVDEAPPDFHARFHARRKTYCYDIVNAPVMPPRLRRTSWHVPHRLDLDAMQQGAALLAGEHDFAAFQSTGSDVKTTVRVLDVSRLSVIPGALGGAAGGLVRYEATGSGFLRHMVRTIVGTLVEIGKGRRPAGDIRAVLESRDRARAGPTAPAHGLTLWAVEY